MTIFRMWAIGLAILACAAVSRAENVASPTIADRQMSVLRAIGAARFDLVQAVHKALGGETAGARAVEAKLVMRGARPVFKLELLVGGELKEVDLDGIDGKVIGSNIETGTEHGEAEMVEIVQRANVSLVEAIRTAIGEIGGGTAVKAQFQSHNGKPACVVDLMAEGFCGSAVVDPATGKLIRKLETECAAALWIFDREKVGAVPPGWRIVETNPGGGLARWKVVADPAGTEQEQVFALAETSNTGGTYNLAIAEKPVFRDVDLEARVRAVSGQEDQGGGPIWRCKDKGNYYICRFNPLESNFRVYCVRDSKRKQLQSADIEAKANRWYALRVRMVGPKIECYVDGKKLLDVEDRTFTEAGKIGLWTKADAATMFDDLAVKAVIDAKPASKPATGRGNGQ